MQEGALTSFTLHVYDLYIALTRLTNNNRCQKLGHEENIEYQVVISQ